MEEQKTQNHKDILEGNRTFGLIRKSNGIRKKYSSYNMVIVVGIVFRSIFH
jgi:hypothetical protein